MGWSHVLCPCAVPSVPSVDELTGNVLSSLEEEHRAGQVLSVHGDHLMWPSSHPPLSGWGSGYDTLSCGTLNIVN